MLVQASSGSEALIKAARAVARWLAYGLRPNTKNFLVSVVATDVLLRVTRDC